MIIGGDALPDVGGRGLRGLSSWGARDSGDCDWWIKSLD